MTNLTKRLNDDVKISNADLHDNKRKLSFKKDEDNKGIEIDKSRLTSHKEIGDYMNRMKRQLQRKGDVKGLCIRLEIY